MPPNAFKLNPAAVSAWKHGISELRAAVGKDDPESVKRLTLLSGRRFVKNAVDITPPAIGKADSTAKKRGEAAILSDLARIFNVMSPQALANFRALNGESSREEFGHRGAAALGEIETRILSRGEMTAWHASRRRKDGRVMQINRDVTTGLRKRDLKGLDTGLVTRADFLWFLKLLQSQVGFLAAGLNAAAAKLGASMPAWIKRHGNRFGSVSVEVGVARIRIRVVQDVPFVDNVRGYARRWNWALNKEVKTLVAQARVIVRKRAAKAGWKMK